MNPASWAWVALVPLLSAYVVVFDLWAEKTHHVTMSAQFHVWMGQQLTGPIIVALWIGISAGLLWHFNINT